MKGTLYLVSTPVGNLEDMTFRAVRILKEVSLILAEDTRVSGKLLKHFEISTAMKSYHDHNEVKVTPFCIDRLKSGESLALITDAGTPGIADPAFFIVREAIREEITVCPVPGATALIPALISSGLPSDRFTFENFLPSKSSKRKRFFSDIADSGRTTIFYETPHRIKKVLAEMEETIPDCAVVIAREITKLHEEFLRGTPKELTKHFSNITPKGEMVVLVSNGNTDEIIFSKSDDIDPEGV